MKTEHKVCQLFLLQQWAVHENRTQSVSAFLTSTVGSPWKQDTKCVSFSYFNSGQSMKTEHEVCQLFLLQQRAVHENRTLNVSAFLTSTAGSPRKQDTKCVRFSYFNSGQSKKTEHKVRQFFLLQQWAVHENRTRSVSVFLTSTVGSPWKQNTKCVSFSYFNSGQSMKTEHTVCQLFLH